MFGHVHISNTLLECVCISGADLLRIHPADRPFAQYVFLGQNAARTPSLRDANLADVALCL